MEKYEIPIAEVELLTDRYQDEAGMLLKDSTVKFIIEDCVNRELARRASDSLDLIAEILELADARSKSRIENLRKEIVAGSEVNVEKLDGLEKHIDKKIAAVHRNIRSGDTVAKMLVKVVEVVNGMTQDSDWVCDECGATASSNTRQMVEIGTPMCSECDREMRLERAPEDVIDHPDFLDGNAMVLRIYEIKAAKEADKKNKLTFKKVKASDIELAHTEAYLGGELLGRFRPNKVKGTPADEKWDFFSNTEKLQSFYAKNRKALLDELKKEVEALTNEQ